MKISCPKCGNKRKREMIYVKLFFHHDEQDDPHYGLRCNLCSHFWEVVKPL